MLVKTSSKRKSKYISIESAQALAIESNATYSLHAVACADATDARPRWFFEIRSSDSASFILQSRANKSRPIYANTPSGVYGIAAELGVDTVALQIPEGEA